MRRVRGCRGKFCQFIHFLFPHFPQTGPPCSRPSRTLLFVSVYVWICRVQCSAHPPLSKRVLCRVGWVMFGRYRVFLWLTDMRTPAPTQLLPRLRWCKCKLSRPHLFPISCFRPSLKPLPHVLVPHVLLVVSVCVWTCWTECFAHPPVSQRVMHCWCSRMRRDPRTARSWCETPVVHSKP